VNLLVAPSFRLGAARSTVVIGKRKPQRELYDVGYLEDLALDPQSFHGQLAKVARQLFADDDFAKLYHARLGRPSVPPSQLALLLLLQNEAGVSDQEAILRSSFDARWCAVLGTHLGRPLCAKSTLQLFRAHLVLHDQVRTVFEQSLKEAKAAGLLRERPLRLAVDTKPMLGRGAVEDTYNLLVTGMRQLVRALAKQERTSPEQWAREHDLSRYFPGRNGSVKGGAEVDWADTDARRMFLTEVVVDARRLWRVAHDLLHTLAEAEGTAIREAKELLGQLLLQDVAEDIDGSGKPQARLKEGTAKDRLPSATDPEQRHGHKSKHRRFTGHKAAIAVDLDSQLIVDAAVLAGNAGDAVGLLEQVERVEARAGLAVASTTGDCAHGNGATRQAFADAGRELLAKVAQERPNRGFFPKSAFVLDLEAATVTCPEGHTVTEYRKTKAGGKVFRFGARCADCPLRSHCTPAARGRSVHVHPQEALLAAARAYQETPTGRAVLRERVGSEHRLARLGQLGIGQARYLGRRKTTAQLLLAATVANLRWLWNWQGRPARRSRPGPAGGLGSPGLPAPAGPLIEPSSGPPGVVAAAVGALGQLWERLPRLTWPVCRAVALAG
jgi:hypothetical protein